MTEAKEQVIKLLNGLAQAVSALTLYKRSHPAVKRSIRTAFDHMKRLQELEPRPVLTFLGEEVIFGNQPIKGLGAWEWGGRLAEVGVQRFECHGQVTLGDFDAFVSALYQRLTGAEDVEVELNEESTIRFGMVGIGKGRKTLSEFGAGVMGYALAEEIAALKWVDDEVRAGGKLHMAEVHTVVGSLAVAMHADSELLIPLVALKDHDQYTTTHSLNISVLSMALGEFMGLSGTDVRRLGVAGLLHDIGKTKVPKELLNKSGKLTPEELASIQRHPAEGARILIQREANLDLAATVAYEHHIRFDGGGYPGQKYKRACHPASDLVHVCDVYDALRTHRPYRKAWGQDRVLAYIEESLGSEFNPTLGEPFLEMMRRWGSRLHRVTSQEDAVPVGMADRPVEVEPDAAPEETSAPVAAVARPKLAKEAPVAPKQSTPVADDNRAAAKQSVAKKSAATKPAAQKPPPISEPVAAQKSSGTTPIKPIQSELDLSLSLDGATPPEKTPKRAAVGQAAPDGKKVGLSKQPPSKAPKLSTTTPSGGKVAPTAEMPANATVGQPTKAKPPAKVGLKTQAPEATITAPAAQPEAEANQAKTDRAKATGSKTSEKLDEHVTAKPIAAAAADTTEVPKAAEQARPVRKAKPVAKVQPTATPKPVAISKTVETSKTTETPAADSMVDADTRKPEGVEGTPSPTRKSGSRKKRRTRSRRKRKKMKRNQQTGVVAKEAKQEPAVVAPPPLPDPTPAAEAPSARTEPVVPAVTQASKPPRRDDDDDALSDLWILAESSEPSAEPLKADAHPDEVVDSSDADEDSQKESRRLSRSGAARP